MQQDIGSSTVMLLVYSKDGRRIFRYPLLPLSSKDAEQLVKQGDQPTLIIQRYRVFLEQRTSSFLCSTPVDAVACIQEEIHLLQGILKEWRRYDIRFELAE